MDAGTLLGVVAVVAVAFESYWSALVIGAAAFWVLAHTVR
jgi:hypothetical protein